MSYSSPIPLPTIFTLILLIGFGTAYYAFRLGKNPSLWFLLGILIGGFAPIILFISHFFERSQNKDDDKPSVAFSEPDASQSVRAIPEVNPAIIEEESKLWYYIGEGEVQVGPVSVLGIAELWNTGRLDLDSYVWTKGMTEWSQVGKVPGLASFLSKQKLM